MSIESFEDHKRHVRERIASKHPEFCQLPECGRRIGTVSHRPRRIDHGEPRPEFCSWGCLDIYMARYLGNETA